MKSYWNNIMPDMQLFKELLVKIRTLQ